MRGPSLQPPCACGTSPGEEQALNICHVCLNRDLSPGIQNQWPILIVLTASAGNSGESLTCLDCICLETVDYALIVLTAFVWKQWTKPELS